MDAARKQGLCFNILDDFVFDTVDDKIVLMKLVNSCLFRQLKGVLWCLLKSKLLELICYNIFVVVATLTLQYRDRMEFLIL